ncbi:proliferating cell nuclear antigen (pcna) [Candidatus Pacearchaeota archaeon]|nr:proliferating cell nuclear antigen (pcna) [Candidatus Pacearchaeota archaeon]
MLVKLDNPTLLSKAVEIISELVTEVRIKISEVGLSIIAIDPANVALVGFKLPRNSFSQFEAGHEILSVNLDNLKQILKRCDTGSSLIMEKKDNLLQILIQDRIKRTFTLSLIDIESEEKEIPQLEYSAKVELNSVDLIDSIEDCAIVADACSFIVQDNNFIIKAKSLNSAMSEFSGDEAKIEAENCKVKFSIEYLQKFMKGAKLSSKTLLQFAEDHPLRMDVKAENFELVFILAPRVETED